MVAGMDAATFRKWLREMKGAGLARTDAECADLIGVKPGAVARYKAEGARKPIALACRALLHRMEPYT